VHFGAGRDRRIPEPINQLGYPPRVGDVVGIRELGVTEPLALVAIPVRTVAS
jgi:hypothetical protein